ncbi:MAG: hypothetical protein K8H88_11520 [Sandaracinaceae bacterium]|nr:hypothetical protein [Sandaracinaceae bacterium]
MMLAPSLARARCSDQERARWMVHQSLVMLLNPLGTEHNARLGLCVPLYPSAERALNGNHLEVGASTYVAPIYALAGGFAQISPATFFIARVELHAQAIWPLPLTGAGYYPRGGYEDAFSSASTPADRGRSTTGWSLRLLGVLRGAIDLSPAVTLYAVDAFWLDYDEIGEATHWVDVRDDLIAARSDWIAANEAVLLMGVRTPGPELRFGAYSTLRFVPASGYGNHQVGPFAMIAWDRPDTHVASLAIFVRLGVYTHHAFREAQLSTMLGAGVDWDLGGL